MQATAAATAKKKNSSQKMLNWRYSLVERHIHPRETVLDIGAGTGWLGQKVADDKNSEVSLVDILDCNETPLPLRIYDGKTLPYEAKSFDVSLLVFVLHHALNQDQILQEAARVTRKRIVIVEDTPKNFVELNVDKFWDGALSLEHGFFAPHNYQKIEKWGEIFQRLGFRVQHSEVIKPFFPFYYTKAVFVLDLA